jgi:hypothetical protein
MLAWLGNCLVNYFGPCYVLFSDDSACMIKVPQPILNPDGDIILEPTFSTCDNHTDTKYTGFNFFFNLANIWLI